MLGNLYLFRLVQALQKARPKQFKRSRRYPANEAQLCSGWRIARRHYRITLADALSAHDNALTFGGRSGISSLHLIESAIARPYSGYHRSIVAKVSALLESMVGNHGFIDGNKRTSLILVELLIERSGYTLQIADDEPVDDLVVAVASNVRDRDIGTRLSTVDALIAR